MSVCGARWLPTPWRPSSWKHPRLSKRAGQGVRGWGKEWVPVLVSLSCVCVCAGVLVCWCAGMQRL